LNYTGQSTDSVETVAPGLAGGAPSKQTLAQILADKRMKLLSELRDIEQALEALEHAPNFEPTMQRVLKILNRSY
jgi:uncharacterized protein HemY